jgi:hypothetical protein
MNCTVWPPAHVYTEEMRWLFAGLIATAALLSSADPLATRAQQKIDLIADAKATPGSVVTFPPAEVNAWLRQQVAESATAGLRDIRVELAAGTLEGFAQVDFLKMAQANGKEVNPLFARVIKGERPLKVSLRVESANGRGTVYLTSVELNGLAITGPVLDFLLENFFLSRFPTAHINEPFELGYNMERVDIRPVGVRVTIKK